MTPDILRVVAIGSLVLLAVSPTHGIDWPQYRGPNRDGTTSERIRWPGDGPKVLWSKDLGRGGNNVAVSRGRLFAHGFEPTGRNRREVIDGVQVNIISGTDILQSFDAETGDRIWRKEFPGMGGWSGQVGPAPCSSPTVDGGRVYFFSRMAVMRCVAVETGAILWQRDLYRDYGLQRSWTGYESSPLLFEGKVLINATSPVGMALDAETGETVWRQGTNAPSHSSHTLFQLEGRTLSALFAGESLSVLEPRTGRLLASYPWETKHWHNTADPIVAQEGILISSGYGMGATMLRFDDDRLTKIWAHRRSGFTQQASMVVRDGYVYGMGTCYRLSDGQSMWLDARPMREGGLILAGDQLVMLDARGTLTIAPAKPDRFEPIVDVPVLDDPAWAAPVLANGRLYVRNVPGILKCLDVASGSSPQDVATVVSESGAMKDAADSVASTPARAELATSPFDQSIAEGENWPRFRGPGGSATYLGKNVPIHFDGETGRGIRWKTKVPLPGNSSPIVWGNQVFLTGADETQRQVYCFDAESGKLHWTTDVSGTSSSSAEPPEISEDTGFAAPTPVTDGQAVFAVFANGDIAGLRMDGGVLWTRSLGIPDNNYGHASSLALQAGRVIVQLDQGTRRDNKSKLMALDSRTGETVWETVRPVPNSWPSPIVIQHDGRPQIITCADPGVIAYAVDNGRELWRVDCLEADVGPSPVLADGVLYVASEFPGVTAIRVGGSGDVTQTHILWESDIGSPDCCSPLVVDDMVMLLPSYATLTCFDRAEGGEPIWEHDLDTNGTFLSSPALAGEYVYLFDDEGQVWVLRPTRERCEEIARSRLGEGCVTSPAFSDDRIYIRGTDHLICIGE